MAANRTPKAWARGATLPNQFQVSRRTFQELEEWIADNEASIVKAKQGMDALVRLLILVVKAEAQRRTMGPVAPMRRSNPALANRIPVQRITGELFAGWTVRRMRWGAWVIYNESRAAYVVEFGIGQKVRRPILKMSVLGMLRFVQTTRTADRFVDYIFAPRRNSRGQFQSFQQRLAGTASLGVVGPSGALPG